jgi:hypothetical protein
MKRNYKEGGCCGTWDADWFPGATVTVRAKNTLQLPTKKLPEPLIEWGPGQTSVTENRCVNSDFAKSGVHSWTF